MLPGGESRGIRLPITRRWRPLWLGSSLPSTSPTVSTLVVLFSRGCSLPLSLFLALSFLFSSSNTPDITTLTWGGLESLRDTFVDSRGRSPHGCISLFNESPRVVLLSRASSTHVTSQISTDVRNRRRRRRPGSLESIAAPHSASRPSDDDDDDDDEELRSRASAHPALKQSPTLEECHYTRESTDLEGFYTLSANLFLRSLESRAYLRGDPPGFHVCSA